MLVETIFLIRLPATPSTRPSVVFCFCQSRTFRLNNLLEFPAKSFALGIVLTRFGIVRATILAQWSNEFRSNDSLPRIREKEREERTVNIRRKRFCYVYFFFTP